jgi:hypothetical protein
MEILTGWQTTSFSRRNPLHEVTFAFKEQCLLHVPSALTLYAAFCPQSSSRSGSQPSSLAERPQASNVYWNFCQL